MCADLVVAHLWKLFLNIVKSLVLRAAALRLLLLLLLLLWPLVWACGASLSQPGDAWGAQARNLLVCASTGGPRSYKAAYPPWNPGQMIPASRALFGVSASLQPPVAPQSHAHAHALPHAGPNRLDTWAGRRLPLQAVHGRIYRACAQAPASQTAASAARTARGRAACGRSQTATAVHPRGLWGGWLVSPLCAGVVPRYLHSNQVPPSRGWGVGGAAEQRDRGGFVKACERGRLPGARVPGACAPSPAAGAGADAPAAGWRHSVRWLWSPWHAGRLLTPLAALVVPPTHPRDTGLSPRPWAETLAGRQAGAAWYLVCCAPPVTRRGEGLGKLTPSLSPRCSTATSSSSCSRPGDARQPRTCCLTATHAVGVCESPGPPRGPLASGKQAPGSAPCRRLP